MGACYDSFSCTADNDRDAVQLCEDHIKQCEWEDGHSAYSGTMATCYGAVMTSQSFLKDWDAHEWLEDNTEKRGNVLGVKVNPVDGNSYYVFGAMCGS